MKSFLFFLEFIFLYFNLFFPFYPNFTNRERTNLSSLQHITTPDALKSFGKCSALYYGISLVGFGHLCHLCPVAALTCSNGLGWSGSFLLMGGPMH